MPTLYVTEQGARIETEAGQILVTDEGALVRAIPAMSVDRLVLVGRVGITTPALELLLDRGIDTVLLSISGSYRGRLTTHLSRNVGLRRKQYRRADDPSFCLAIAKAIVRGKIRNQRTLCLRWDETNDDPLTKEVVDELARLREESANATSVDTLMGLEGRAARRYYSVFRRSLQTPWVFHRRARRPPPDPINALLSLLYTLLHDACFSALEASGLDPTVGFLHQPAYGRASLALDLMEEFRPLIADSVVLSLVNREMLTLDDFSGPPDAVRLTKNGLRVVAEQYAKRLETLVTPEGLQRRISYRKLLEIQARSLRKVIEGTLDSYAPFAPK